MQQNKTVSQQKTINPVYWVPTAYFAMGLPFIAINLVSVFMFKDLGVSAVNMASCCFANSILDFSYYDALDTEIPVESFS